SKRRVSPAGLRLRRAWPRLRPSSRHVHEPGSGEPKAFHAWRPGHGGAHPSPWPSAYSLLDIIANKILRHPAVNSKVLQSTGDLHNKIVILFFRISENVFDNATAFNPSNDMLDHNPDT